MFVKFELIFCFENIDFVGVERKKNKEMYIYIM